MKISTERSAHSWYSRLGEICALAKGLFPPFSVSTGDKPCSRSGKPSLAAFSHSTEIRSVLFIFSPPLLICRPVLLESKAVFLGAFSPAAPSHTERRQANAVGSPPQGAEAMAATVI